ncbi:MAG: hypothetical protein F6K24_03410 [Okeania sp. SIO2D1]|nr:hypothetical protein [Okeania sp. SIO2D1]
MGEWGRSKHNKVVRQESVVRMGRVVRVERVGRRPKVGGIILPVSFPNFLVQEA